MSVFPNPATNYITLSVNATSAQSVSVTLYDIAGRAVFKQQSSLIKGKQQFAMSLPSIAKGMYMLSLNNAAGMIASRAVTVQ